MQAEGRTYRHKKAGCKSMCICMCKHIHGTIHHRQVLNSGEKADLQNICVPTENGHDLEPWGSGDLSLGLISQVCSSMMSKSMSLPDQNRFWLYSPLFLLWRFPHCSRLPLDFKQQHLSRKFVGKAVHKMGLCLFVLFRVYNFLSVMVWFLVLTNVDKPGAFHGVFRHNLTLNTNYQKSSGIAYARRLPWWLISKESICSAGERRRCEIWSLWEEILWRKDGNPLQYSCPGKSRG